MTILYTCWNFEMILFNFQLSDLWRCTSYFQIYSLTLCRTIVEYGHKCSCRPSGLLYLIKSLFCRQQFDKFQVLNWGLPKPIGLRALLLHESAFRCRALNTDAQIPLSTSIGRDSISDFSKISSYFASCPVVLRYDDVRLWASITRFRIRINKNLRQSLNRIFTFFCEDLVLV